MKAGNTTNKCIEKSLMYFVITILFFYYINVMYHALKTEWKRNKPVLWDTATHKKNTCRSVFLQHAPL